MEPLYYSTSGELKIKIDAVTRNAISKIVIHASALIGGRDPFLVSRELGIEPGENPFEGLELLKTLARTKASSLVTTGKEMNLTMALLCFCAINLEKSEEEASALASVLVSLSRVTPVRLPAWKLPPSAEVFGKRSIEPAVLDAFEKLRMRSSAGAAHLYLFEVYQLWRALLRIRVASGRVKQFTSVLDASSILFRFALERLAFLEISTGATNEIDL